jgi:hypothetical protein
MNHNTMVYAVTVAAARPFPAGALATNICPECNDVVTDPRGDEHHVAIEVDGHVFVIVGCEGYWVVDPNLVGIPSDTWMSLDAQRVAFDI